MTITHETRKSNLEPLRPPSLQRANTIYKSGIAVIEGDKLLVQKTKDIADYLLPGGTVEAGETYRDALIRELQEEMRSKPARLHYFGPFKDTAAGRIGMTVHIEVFLGELIGVPRPGYEVERLIWFGLQDDRNKLSPIIRNRILPALIRRGYL